MSDEAYIDRYLQDIIDLDRFRAAYVHSKHVRNFFGHNKGDRVSLWLSGVAIDGVAIEQDQRIEGVIADTANAIVEVRYGEGNLAESWVGRKIGLAVLSDNVHKNKSGLFAHYMGGDQTTAYFLSEDFDYFLNHKPSVADEKIHILAMRYTKLAIDGAVIFDFSTTEPEQPEE